MIQEVFRIGSFPISPFGLVLVLSLFLGYWQLKNALLKLGSGDEEDASAIIFAGGLFGILGGKVYFAVLQGDWRILFDRAGIVYYGCIFGGLMAVLFVIHRRQLPVARTFDGAALAVAVGYAVGRIGCFLVGDDYGIPTSLPWGVIFRVGLPPTTAGNLEAQFGVDVPPELVGSEGFVAVHPTQLYETLTCLGILFFGRWLLDRRPPPGGVALPVFSLLAAERFLIEFIRAKDDRFLGTFTLAQAISLLFLLALGILAWRRRGQTAAAAA